MENTGSSQNKKAKHTISKVPKAKLINSSKVEKILAKADKSFFYSSKLFKNFKQEPELHVFIQELFKFKELKHFSRIHLLIHEKGERESINYEYTKSEILSSKFSVDTFTNLFNSIKKSKDRSFGEISLKGTPFDIMGTFLAHEFSFRYHSVILIIGRDDFLPQQKEDKFFLKFLAPLLKSYIEAFVENTKEVKQIKVLKKSLEESVYKFKFYKNEECLFSNVESFKNEPIKVTLDLNSYFLIDQDNTDLLDQADIFHQERVTLLGDLFNTLKHELSNPLFGLQLSSELLLMEDLNSEQKTFVQEINLSIKRSQEIIENFKDLYNDELEFKNLNVIEILNEVFTLTKSKSRNLKKEIIVTDDLSDSEIILNSNSTWLAQIFFNLIVNSAEACESIKGPELVITFELNSNNLIINFHDNGPGIDEDSDIEIFTPFYTTKDKGTGLGLAICKNLAKKLGGSLNLVETSKGASFDLILPYGNSSN